MRLSMMSRKVAALTELHRRMLIRQYSNYGCGRSMGVSSLNTTTTSTNSMHNFVETRSWDNKRFENYTNFRATTNRCMSCYSPTKPMFDKIIVKVPTMGDSITEGTIVEWTAAVGQAVKTDDVIALIETDKVTIDIKADMDGVITQHFGSVDETVEVGAKLYELDTDAVASVIAPASSAQSTATTTPSDPAPKQSNVPTPTATPPTSDHRSPSIRFLGKEGWEALRKGHDTKKQALNVDPTPPLKKHAVKRIIDDRDVKDPMYGRPKFTEAEMEALLTGGATLAPHVLSLSTGAKFKL